MLYVDNMIPHYSNSRLCVCQNKSHWERDGDVLMIWKVSGLAEVAARSREQSSRSET